MPRGVKGSGKKGIEKRNDEYEMEKLRVTLQRKESEIDRLRSTVQAYKDEVILLKSKLWDLNCQKEELVMMIGQRD